MDLLSKDGIVKGGIVAIVGGVGTAAVLAFVHFFKLTVAVFMVWLATVGRFLVTDVTLPRWVFWLWAGL